MPGHGWLVLGSAAGPRAGAWWSEVGLFPPPRLRNSYSSHLGMPQHPGPCCAAAIPLCKSRVAALPCHRTLLCCCICALQEQGCSPFCDRTLLCCCNCGLLQPSLRQDPAVLLQLHSARAGLQPSLRQEGTRAQLGLLTQHCGLCSGCSQHLRLHSWAGSPPQLLLSHSPMYAIATRVP